MAAGKSGKYTEIYLNTKKCEFYDIGTHIVATALYKGTTFCAFFGAGQHTVDSVKKRGSIKLHSVYAKK